MALSLLRCSSLLVVFLLFLQPLGFAQEFEEFGETKFCLEEVDDASDCTAHSYGDSVILTVNGEKFLYGSGSKVNIPTDGGPYILTSTNEMTAYHNGKEYIISNGNVVFHDGLPMAAQKGSFPTIQFTDDNGILRRVTIGSLDGEVFFVTSGTISPNKDNVIAQSSDGLLDVKCKSCSLLVGEKEANVEEGTIKCSIGGCPDGLKISQPEGIVQIEKAGGETVSKCPSEGMPATGGVVLITGNALLPWVVGGCIAVLFLGAGLPSVFGKVNAETKIMGAEEQWRRYDVAYSEWFDSRNGPNPKPVPIQPSIPRPDRSQR